MRPIRISPTDQERTTVRRLATTLPNGAKVTLSLEGADFVGPSSVCLRQALDAAAEALVSSISVPMLSATSEGPGVATENDATRDGRFARCGLLGRGPAMERVSETLARVAPAEANVLIAGENGTGKEVVARALHQLSSRSESPWVALSCAALNDNLLESELFGHRRGAFTGAVNDKDGLFAKADGGTLFLDEVGEMSPALQVKLLRVLQDGVFFPVGSIQSSRVDVRVVAATNRDLRERVAAGLFREDLYYRLNVVCIELPPLRERREDISLLAKRFVERLGRRDGRRRTLSRGLLAELENRDWPGNIRELENELERIWVLSGDEDPIVGDGEVRDETQSNLASKRPSSFRTRRDGEARPRSGEWALALPQGHSLAAAIDELERTMIADALNASAGNKTHAARLLGISRRNLIRKVQSYELECRDDRPSAPKRDVR